MHKYFIEYAKEEDLELNQQNIKLLVDEDANLWSRTYTAILEKWLAQKN